MPLFSKRKFQTYNNGTWSPSNISIESFYIPTMIISKIHELLLYQFKYCLFHGCDSIIFK